MNIACKSLVAVTFATLVVGCATDPNSPDDPAYSQSESGKADSGWSHLDFKSVEGTSIRVDFQLSSSTSGSEYTQTANPVWVNVQRADLDNASGVHVWIGDQEYVDKEGYDGAARYGGLSNQADHNLDLYRSPDASRFTGDIPNGLTASNYENGDDEAGIHAYQFAIVIDGQWQTDPISGSHNFLAKSLLSFYQ